MKALSLYSYVNSIGTLFIFVTNVFFSSSHNTGRGKEACRVKARCHKEQKQKVVFPVAVSASEALSVMSQKNCERKT